MSVLDLSEEENKKIIQKHIESTKNNYIYKDETKKGLLEPQSKKVQNKKTS
jgi:hypothetical protein